MTIYHRPATGDTSIGAQLVGWLSADMAALTKLVDEVDAETFATDDAFTTAQRLMTALETAIAAAEQHRHTFPRRDEAADVQP